MTQDSKSWDLIQDLIERASDLAPSGRAALLDAECPEELRQEVDELLAALGDDTGLPGATLAERLADHLATTPAPDEDALQPGQIIGHFTVVRRIGRGGMGEVYEAQQTEPVRRRVALKVVRAADDSAGMLRRFERERRALARMEHPGIAQVFEAGATTDGQPWVAMELVDGTIITDYCTQRALPLRQRIELFVRICRAVQHAHVKGVLHRDLKPSNLLVVEVDDEALPKVIDFGIAKALGRESEELDALVDHTGETKLGQVIGTPEYMSPEQANLLADIDTRSDVFALGVILFELLAGRSPWPTPRNQLDLIELQRQMRTVTPQRPSELISDRAVPAASEHLPATHRLPRELDWVALRALANEPSERYQSPADLADDLERFLRHEPIEAAPQTTTYRLRKWTQRHRTTAVLGPLAAFVLVAFATTSRVQFQRTERALERAEAESSKASEVSAFLIELLQENDPNVSRGEPRTVETLLDEGAERLLDDQAPLSSQPDLRASLLGLIGQIYINTGEFPAATRLFERAADLVDEGSARPGAEVATAFHFLGLLYSDRGEFETGRQLLDRALDLRLELFGDVSAEIASSYDGFGIHHRMLDQYDTAAAAHRKAQQIRSDLGLFDDSVSESHNLLGIALRNAGDLDGAIDQYEAAITSMEQLHGVGHPPITQVRSNLALAQHVNGEFARARETFEQLLPEIERIKGTEHPDLAATRANYAALLIDLERFAAAEEQLDAALEVRRLLDQSESIWFANELSQRATARAGMNRLRDARLDTERALELRRRLFDPLHHGVANELMRLAKIDLLTQRWAEAERNLDAALAIFVEVANPAQLTVAQFELGLLMLERDRPEEAAAYLSEAVARVLQGREPESRAERAQWDALQAAAAVAASDDRAVAALEWLPRINAHDQSRLRRDSRLRLERVRRLLEPSVRPMPPGAASQRAP